jgi:hypothetical protein
MTDGTGVPTGPAAGSRATSPPASSAGEAPVTPEAGRPEPGGEVERGRITVLVGSPRLTVRPAPTADRVPPDDPPRPDRPERDRSS